MTATLPPVGERLKSAMAAYAWPDGRRGMTWKELAGATGLDRSSIARIRADKIDPARKTLFALGTALEVDPAWLAGYRDAPTRWPWNGSVGEAEPSSLAHSAS